MKSLSGHRDLAGDRERGDVMKPEAQAVPGCTDPQLGASLEGYLQRELTPKSEQAFEEHYFVCRPCLDEIRMRQALPGALRPGEQAEQPPFLRRLPLVAAGLALLALAYPAWLGVVELPSARRDASRIAADQASLAATVEDLRVRLGEAEARFSAALSWSGPAGLVVLGPPPRGHASAHVLKLGAGQPHAPLMVVPPDMSGLPERTILEFSVSGPDGFVVWSRGLSVEEIRGHVAASGTVPFLLPSRILPAGLCRLQVKEGSPDGRELMTVHFEVAHRD